MQIRPTLQPLEAALASLVPRAESLDQDAILFRAGEEAARVAARRRPGRFLWPAVWAISAALAGSLLTALVVRPEPQVIERVRIVEVAVPAPAVVPDAHRPKPAEPQAAPPVARQPADWPAPEALAGRPRAQALDALARALSERENVPDSPGLGPLSAVEPAEPKPYREWLEAMLDDTARGPRTPVPSIHFPQERQL